MASATKKLRKMSFDEFLTHLRNLRGQFTIPAGGRYLRMGGGVCPVSGVCNLLKNTSYACHVSAPAADMNMSRSLAWQIADAADGYTTRRPRLRNYRNRMLRALKLRERT